jgi:hypothetical protein
MNYIVGKAGDSWYYSAINTEDTEYCIQDQYRKGVYSALEILESYIRNNGVCFPPIT